MRFNKPMKHDCNSSLSVFLPLFDMLDRERGSVKITHASDRTQYLWIFAPVWGQVRLFCQSINRSVLAITRIYFDEKIQKNGNRDKSMLFHEENFLTSLKDRRQSRTGKIQKCITSTSDRLAKANYGYQLLGLNITTVKSKQWHTTTCSATGSDITD